MGLNFSSMMPALPGWLGGDDKKRNLCLLLQLLLQLMNQLVQLVQKVILQPLNHLKNSQLKWVEGVAKEREKQKRREVVDVAVHLH